MKSLSCGRSPADFSVHQDVAQVNEHFVKAIQRHAFKTQHLLKVVDKNEWSHDAEEGA